ncbi:MAG: membrane protein [Peptococcaceae bacterium BRH_c4b]|nr:MAG: membrane protein [Peptococcaceae bacterium BRH_c4b]
MMTEKATAGDIMTREVVTVTPGDDVEKVARLLLERRISGLPVVDGEGKVVGIISEGDMVIQQEEIKAPVYTNILGGIIYLERPQRFMEDLKRHIAQKVGDLMSGRVHTVVPETPVEKVATMMVEKGINRVPVVDGDQKLLGIITRQDVIKAAYRG